MSFMSYDNVCLNYTDVLYLQSEYSSVWEEFTACYKIAVDTDDTSSVHAQHKCYYSYKRFSLRHDQRGMLLYKPYIMRSYCIFSD